MVVKTPIKILLVFRCVRRVKPESHGRRCRLSLAFFVVINLSVPPTRCFPHRLPRPLATAKTKWEQLHTISNWCGKADLMTISLFFSPLVLSSFYANSLAAFPIFNIPRNLSEKKLTSERRGISGESVSDVKWKVRA